MKMFKHISALIVACVISLSFMGCSGDDESKTDSAESNTPSEATSEEVSENTSEATSEEVSEVASSEVSEEVSEEDNVDPSKPRANAIYGTPSIDANNIDPLWDSVPEYRGEILRPCEMDTNTRFVFKLMWDETHLYVYEKVFDLTIGPHNPNVTYMNDSTEINFSLNNNRTRSYNYNTDMSIGITPHKDIYWGQAIVVLGENFKNMAYNVTYDETGYVILASFNIKDSIKGFEWKEGHRIGFEISVNDSITADSRACCIAWADDSDTASLDPSTFGVVTLVKEA